MDEERVVIVEHGLSLVLVVVFKVVVELLSSALVANEGWLLGVALSADEVGLVLN